MTELDFFQRKAEERETAVLSAANEAKMVLAGKWKYPDIPDSKQAAKAAEALNNAAKVVAEHCKAPSCRLCKFNTANHADTMVDGQPYCSLISSYMAARIHYSNLKETLSDAKHEKGAAEEEISEISRRFESELEAPKKALESALKAISDSERELGRAEAEYKAEAAKLGVKV